MTTITDDKKLILQLIAVIELAMQYLAKAEADGLMQNCVRRPMYALDKCYIAVAMAKEYLRDH